MPEISNSATYQISLRIGPDEMIRVKAVADKTGLSYREVLMAGVEALEKKK